MKVTAILSSPRENSASSAFAEYFLDTLKQKSTECSVDKFILRDMQYSGCNACYLCQTTNNDDCVIDDDLQLIFKSLYKADLLFIASPIYFDHVPSQLKAFIDRCNQLYLSDFLTNDQKSKLPKGKTFAIVTTQETKGSMRYRAIQDNLHFFFRHFGFTNFYFMNRDRLGIEFDLNNHKEFYNVLDKNAEAIVTLLEPKAFV